MDIDHLTAPKPVQGSKLPAYSLGYSGQVGTLYGLWIKKILLSIVTLGIYSFWGKTAIRQYMISSTNIIGLPFQYLGTGKELFIGFLKIIPFYIVFVIVFAILKHVLGEGIAQGIVTVFVLLLIPVAQYAALRYRVNRIAWCGVRGQMGGSAFAYGGYHLLGTFKKLLTLGYMSPIVDMCRYEYKLREMGYGDLGFDFALDTTRLVRTNITTLLLAIPTLFISRLWYSAALLREAARATSINGVRFKFKATGGEILGLVIVNLLIIIFTLGLGTPFVMQRNVRFMTDRFKIGGDLNSIRAGQRGFRGAGAAEGIEDVWNIGDDGMAGLVG